MQVVSEALGKPRKISHKGTTDLVTETDIASEEAVLKVRGVAAAAEGQ
jgi:hypothetical protein